MAFWTGQQRVNGVHRELPAEDITALWPRVSIRVPDDLHVALKVLAAQRHTTVQHLALQALERLVPPG